MDILVVLTLIAYIAWRERSHALERQALLAHRPSPVASSRRRGKERARVLSAEDDAAFNEAREG